MGSPSLACTRSLRKEAMFRKLIVIVLLFQCGSLSNAKAMPEADSAYHAPSYSPPSSSYGAPAERHHGGEVVHVHNHYYHDGPPPSKPSYRPSYDAYNYAPHYQQPYQETYYDDDEYIHLNKKELTRAALLFGAGLLKGVVVTSHQQRK